MVGRAARGNPWIFSGHTPTTEQVRAMILRHARLLVEHKGEFTGIREMRKHFAWYTAGCPNSAALRNRVNYVESMGELEALVMEILK
jgi:tRNA-dihydrouridine synthase